MTLINVLKTLLPVHQGLIKHASLSSGLLLPIFCLNTAFAQTPADSEVNTSEAVVIDQSEQLPVELTADINEENLEQVYRNVPSNIRFENLTPASNLHESPYQVSLFSAGNGEDKKRFYHQNNSIFAYGFGVIGIIALLPEDVSNWDKEEGIFGKWSDNVKSGPVWDQDSGMLNLVGHPYFGGVYYQVARKSGYRQWDAFVYSTLMSTFYWEYGIEAFAETPSIQDLVITPVLGWAYGEWAFSTEMDIRRDGGTVWGSDTLGSVALAFLDPVDSLNVGINNLFGAEIIRAGTGYIDVKEVPYGDNGQTDKQVSFNISLQLGDGSTYSGPSVKTASRVHDPIDYGIIGLTYGVGHVALDDLWAMEGGTTRELSLGLYFSSAFSSRLTYSNAHFTDGISSEEIKYENYSLDGQYYLNAEGQLRPYVTFGIGETVWNKAIESKRFQINSGLGAHYQLTNKFALQLDWRFYHSTNANTSDHNTSFRLVYQLGDGAR